MNPLMRVALATSGRRLLSLCNFVLLAHFWRPLAIEILAFIGRAASPWLDPSAIDHRQSGHLILPPVWPLGSINSAALNSFACRRLVAWLTLFIGLCVCVSVVVRLCLCLRNSNCASGSNDAPKSNCHCPACHLHNCHCSPSQSGQSASMLLLLTIAAVVAFKLICRIVSQIQPH